MTWSIPSTVSSGGQIQATTTNAIIADLSIIGGAWTADARSSSTIWTASTPPALGNGTLVSRYRQVDKNWWWEVVITMGSTTTYGSGTWQLVPPFTPYTTGGQYPAGALLDTSAGSRYALYAIKNSGNFSLQASVTAGALSSVNATSPMTWATGDQLTFFVMSEAT